MVTSLKFESMLNVSINKYGKFLLNENVTSVKEVPFIRYEFDRYTDVEIDYINKMLGKFSLSGHMAEVELNENSVESIINLREKVGNIAIYLYLDVYDEDVRELNLVTLNTEHLKNVLPYIKMIDRVMLRDNSTTLHNFSYVSMKNNLKIILKIKDDKIGICNSPLSIGKECCLSAVKARELAAKYALSSDCTLPSAFHEGTDCCGCIRYVKVETDITCQETVKVKKEPKEKKIKEVREVKEKVVKKKMPKNVVMKW